MSKVVFVTGSSRGIGKEIAKKFAEQDFKVVINCVNRVETLNETLEELKSINSNIMAVVGDVSNYETCISMFKQIEETFGKVDILVNNAGISFIGMFNEMLPSEWQELIKINIEGVINCSHIACKNMILEKYGKIINISSIWGNSGASCEVVYSATKGAVNSFTKSLARELAPSNVIVNAVACGVIDTEMNDFMSDDEKDEFSQQVIPLMRFGNVEEVANLVMYLASDKSSYITGQIISIDGGYF